MAYNSAKLDKITNNINVECSSNINKEFLESIAISEKIFSNCMDELLNNEKHQDLPVIMNYKF